MKLVIPEISWHNRDPVLSVHFQPIAEDGYYRLATGGSDSHVFVNYLFFYDFYNLFIDGCPTTLLTSDMADQGGQY